jgi:HAD superfamily hydrolase (TIGR01509 family)
MALSWLLFDWGDTLMSEEGPGDVPMADWPEVRLIPGAATVLGELAARYAIAVATNATVSDRAAITRALARGGLDRFVREIFCFRELGLKKSDPRFWDAVAARLGVPPSALVMIGDDLDNDVLAPRRAGLAALWLNWKRAPVPAGVDVPMIERLDQLPALLL